MEGLLTAFQQLCYVQKQLQAESRQCKLALYRLRRDARARTASSAAAEAATTPPASATPAEVAAAGSLAALNQLRASTDDAQDLLLSLVAQLLEVGMLQGG